MNENVNKFGSLDFGTKPTTTTLESIFVEVDPTAMLRDFAAAYLDELMRRNLDRATATGLTVDDLDQYFTGLLRLRVMFVNGNSQYWRQAKALWIPSWIEAVISNLGEVIDVDRGLIFKPVMKGDVNIDDLLRVSDALRLFTADGLGLHKDAFPRRTEGDPDVMSMAIIDGFIRSMSAVHPIASYMAAFAGLKLQQEESFKILYRVRYDDFNFVKAMLMREGSIRE